ncbi:MAG TPA: 3'-5' exonuclease, partial [Phycisphaerae bacterium]|nr:3'-5' exonuclease [Phycisphaerae bacterium]
RLARWRERIRQRPIAEVLWQIYEETDYLACVSGLPGGRVRRDHLLRLHELARQFGTFSRQGLHRFLRFIDDLVRNELQPQQPAGPGAADNAVRIMSIHGSKGLEFPVVIVADAGKVFNLEDTRAAVLVDRLYGIGMQAVDAERRVRYPTLVHQLAAEHLRLDTLSEELRVWYVALTRAREHLVIVGRVPLAGVALARARHTSAEAAGNQLSQLEMETACKPLDWLLPAFCRLPSDQVTWSEESDTIASGTLFHVHTLSRATTDTWRIPPVVDTDRTDVLARMGRLEPLPADEPVADAVVIEPIIEALTWTYPGLELTTMPARIGVTEIKRRWEAIADPDERPATGRAIPAAATRPAFIETEPTTTAVTRGTAAHRFLQLADLQRRCDAGDLARQRNEMVRQGRLPAADTAMVDIDAVAWFFETELGRRLRSGCVRREVAFVSRVSPDKVDPLVHGRDHRDVVLIRGIVDVVLEMDDGIEVIDYKTDDVPADACETRAEGYRAQIDTYAAAMEAIYRRPVRGRHLVFLSPRRVVTLT